MLRVSMNELTTLRWSFEEDVRNYAEAGFDGIGIWRQKLSDVGDEQGAALLRQAGISCSNLLWAGGFTGSDGFSFRDSLCDAVAAIRTAAAISADNLVIYTGPWGGHTRTHARRLVENAIEELLPFAEEFAVSLAFEPMHPGCCSEWTFLRSIDEALELIDPFENPFLKLAVDTYHLGIDGHDLKQLAEVAHRVAIVHLGDGQQSPDGEQDRCPLGEGRVQNLEIIECLSKAGYDGYVDVELIGESLEPHDYPTIVKMSRQYAGNLVTSSS